MKGLAGVLNKSTDLRCFTIASFRSHFRSQKKYWVRYKSTLPAQEKPTSKTQGELVVHEEERQKAIQDIVPSWERVKAFAMDTENIRVLQFVKERLDQAIQPVMESGRSEKKREARREATKRYYEKNKSDIIEKKANKRRRAREANVHKYEVPAGIQVI